ncbi:MAG: phenylalanine--tRNA ligase subunit beta [Bacillota bacterium]|jgi:phenylalanyl-tRNA synthetase beta chain|nr:phenylalanine--tRNA ligase subunit beta [Bacillota bacterium]HPZ54724.1 phenylalanine--tRNA ligase subunit beta [Bacillota bacterium]
MKLSLNWLRDHVDIDDKTAEQLPELLTMSTAEVESVEHLGRDIRNVVAGKVVSLSPHPTSSKLSVIQVDIGSEVVQSVCGAPNVRVGMMIPFAPCASSLPDVECVRAAEIDGVASNGIACSQRELGIGDAHEGVFELTDECKPGDSITDVLKLRDTVLEIDNKSLTHRPDLWGHYGFAREIAALTGRPLRPLEMSELEGLMSADVVVPVAVDDPEKCYRYCALGIEGVDTRPSPGWLQTRLAYVGMRPINFIVDLTNYIMLELGQPMHAFDSNMIQAIRVMTFGQVKAAGYSGSTFTTLDGVEREMPDTALMICNHYEPVAIAGVMGGENSEVEPSTTAILLESATFDPVSVRRTATALGLRTEACMRFEKSLDTNMALIATRRFLYLTRQVIPTATVYSGLADAEPKPTRPISLSIDSEYVSRYAGTEIPPDRIESILTSLGFTLKRKDANGRSATKVCWDVEVPTYRATKDVTLPVDLIEEVTRVYGYGNIEPKSKAVALSPIHQDEHIELHYRIKQMLSASFGMSEIHTYSWYDKDWNREIDHKDDSVLTIANPGISKYDTLRRHLVPNLLAAAARNEGYFDEFRLFEIGSVYHPAPKDAKTAALHDEQAVRRGDALRIEDTHVCCIVHWKGRSEKQEDGAFDILKQAAWAVCEQMRNTTADFEVMDEQTAPEASLSWVHPVKRCLVSSSGIKLGYITVINPRLLDRFVQGANMAIMELNLSAFADVPMAKPSFAEPPRYPEVSLDFSLLVDLSMRYRALSEVLDGFSHDLLRSISYVDTYTGAGLPQGKKSVTIAVTIGSDDHTLSSQEIDGFSNAFISWLADRGISLR